MADTLAALKRLRAKMDPNTKRDNAIRTQLLQETRRLMLDLEIDEDIPIRVGWQIWETICIDIATNMGIMRILRDESSVSSASLAEKCNGELEFVQRIMRCLVAYGVVQRSADGFVATTVSNTFATDRGVAMIHTFLEFLTRGWVLLPAELKKKGYRVHKDSGDTSFNTAFGRPKGQTIWQMSVEPQWADDWRVVLQHWTDGHQDWLDIYPLRERLVQGADAEGVFMVDVGGFHGAQAAGVRARFPDAPGRFVVQDLEWMLLKEPLSGLENMAHDFFEPQPLSTTGARLYYMRFISHDWAQERVVEILRVLRGAMRPRYSKVIIHDWIVPDEDPGIYMASQDMNMISIGGGEERSEQRHREYIRAAGLKVTGIWDFEDGISEAIIECEMDVDA